MSIAFFWLEINIYEVLLTFRESLLALSQLSTLISSLFTVVWTLLMSLSDAKTVVSSAKWTKRIWFEDLYMSLIYKRKSTGPNADPCGTPNVMFDTGTAVFNWLRRIVSCYSNTTQTSAACHLWRHYAEAYSSICYD